VALELWTTEGGLPGESTAETARRTEQEGWDGFTVGDSHVFAPDPYARLGVIASATSHLKIGTWVTNPVTRNVAITAAAIGGIQAESGGRAYLGIGRGDSPLAYLGLKPASPAYFERYLIKLQRYLRGEDVENDDAGTEAALC
jgi:5,10-methylenetetrahydromethanopterin reductase